jgi:hypothetical protein
MFVRRLIGVAFALSLLIACSSNEGDSTEGGSCGSQSDCGGDLSCQPVHGRTGDYCCPAPASASTHANCQPVD